MLEINQELRNLIPPLQKEERELLEKSIIEEGCRDSIIVWDNTIIDGHNRYEICKENDIEFKTNELEFENVEQVKEWMINNQFSRRNLPLYQRAVLALKLKPIYEEKAKENLSMGGKIKGEPLLNSVKAENEPIIIKPINTQKELAKQAGVSQDTISKVEKIEAKAPIEIKEKLSSGEISINQAYKEIKKTERKEKLKQQSKELSKQELIINGKIIHDDFFNAIKDIDDKSIDLLFVDPPYAILKEEWDNVDIAEFTEKWLKETMPKVKDTGRIYISFSHAYMFELYKILNQNDNFGFNFGQILIWQYRNNNKPSDRKMYRHAYEPIFYLYGKDAEGLNFTDDTYGEIQNTVWTIATPQSNFKEGKHHPAQKPLELLERIIKTGSKQGDLVLDPFAGSGTTGVICEKFKRDYILIERDDEYVEIIKGRLNELERETI